MKDISAIATRLTEIVKKPIEFKWDDDQDKTFNLLKDKICFALVLVMQDFTKAFKVKSDASGIGIGRGIGIGIGIRAVLI